MPPIPKLAAHGRALGQTLAELLFPQYCGLCRTRIFGNENGYYCPACWAASLRVERPYCFGCARPHPPAAGFASRENFLCPDCRESKRPHRFCIAAAYYEGAIAHAVKRLKFDAKQRLAGPLGNLMAEAILRELPVPEYTHLVPVPLFRVRQRERGFNQAHLLAQAACGALVQESPRLRLDTTLTRIRPTRVQSRLTDAAERRANVRGAFAVIGDGMRGARVLLIDDVVTTGGTVVECARALKRAGAELVDVAAVAVAAPIPH